PPLAGPSAGPGAGSPQRIVIESAGVRAPVVRRGLDAYGAVDPPPYATPDVVGWYGGSARPGARGVALFVGHLDTESEPAVFRRLSAIRAGSPVRVVRGDGEVAEFTVESVEVFGRERFDARRVYGQHRPDRAELRLLTCGGRYDPATRSYSANVVVSAYLTGTGRA
ncbi:MAG TPA: class F sortase, partial [Streptomyces sp.]|nr:class F sortase [Streptomyces sp.]